MKVYTTNHSNVNLLIETELTLPVGDLQSFQNCLLGALSVEVDPTVWKECIETTLSELRRVKRIKENAEKL